ncbi:MAG: hypothetical protein AB7W59_19085 [Acidimicrobiia bacterium]
MSEPRNASRREVDLLDPRSYPLTDDVRDHCDLVMKGGITSGVIYPYAVCQLATGRRLHRVGGTSAGAIAAGAAAAAELGRDVPRRDAGFARLAALPTNLAAPVADGHTRLYHLFQPQPQTAPLYRLVAVALASGSRTGKVFRACLAGIRAVRPWPGAAAIGAPAIILVGAVWQRAVWGVVAALLLLLAGTATAVAWSLIRRMVRDLPANSFGLCTGMRSPKSDKQALTEWLADEYDQLAGRDPSGPPLTFGDLAAKQIELAMFTTDLSAATQNELPFRSRIWAFDRNEFAQIFPERVVQWMVARPPTPRDEDDREAFAGFAAAGLHPLPLAADLPVIVAVRMSLSFPLLLTTVPLHAYDYSSKPPKLVRHHFSDGGITSNFPIHFFDEAAPSRPTFGIDLISSDNLDPDPARNVSMPDDNRDGILATVTPIETFSGFVGALRNSIQNWADSMQTRIPGYRDRIVAVRHSGEAGGMNLDMGSAEVLKLAELGRHAGIRAEQFDFVNHRWVRLRSFLQTLEELTVPAATAIEADRLVPGVPSYREMIRGAPPTSYRRYWNAADGDAVVDALVALAEAYRQVRSAPDSPAFERGAPSPKPRLQIRPRP